MDMAALISVAVGLAAAGGVALAAFLGLRARSAPGALALAGFCLVVAAWSTCLLAGGHVGAIGLAATTPVGGAAFLHFAQRFAHPSRAPDL